MNAIEAVMHLAVNEPGAPVEALMEYMRDSLTNSFVAIVDANASDEALERIDPETVQRTSLLLVQNFLAWHGRFISETPSEVEARAARIVAGAADRLGIAAPEVPVPLDIKPTAAWAVRVVDALGLSSTAAPLLAVSQLSEIHDATWTTACSWSWKDKSPALVQRAMADFATVTTLAFQAAPRDAEVWMQLRSRKVSMLIARYFGEPSREGEILRLSEKAAERLLADRSVALLLRELDRDSPKAWRELLLLAFVSLVTLSDRPLEQPEVLLVVTRGLDVNIEEVLARPDTTLAFTKFWPSEPETTSTSTSRAPATSYTSNEVVGFLANDSVRIIDVRDAGSFGRHRIPSAVFIEPSLVVERLKDEARPVVLYCRSGDVSKGIADDLARHRDGVGWLAGGYIAWEVTGHRIERP